MKKTRGKAEKKTEGKKRRDSPSTDAPQKKKPRALIDPATGRFLPGNPTAWKPGQSGNPKGRPPDALKRMKTVLKEILSRRTPGDNQTLYCKLGEVIVREALKGDERFVKLILDRIEGPVPHVLEGGADTPPLQFVIRPVIEGRTAEDPAAEDVDAET